MYAILLQSILNATSIPNERYNNTAFPFHVILIRG